VFACRLIGAAIVFITHILLARWLGAEEFGVYVLAFSWGTLLAALAVFGFPPSALRFIGNELALGNDQLIKGFIYRGTQTIFISSVSISIAGYILLLLLNELMPISHTTTMLLAILSISLFALLRWFASIAYAFGWYITAVIPDNLLRPLLLLLITAALWHFQHRLTSSIVMLTHIGVVAFLLFLLVIILLVRVKPRLSIITPEYEYRLWISTALSLMIITLFNNYFIELNVIIAGMHIEAEQLAIFSAAVRTAFLISFGVYAIDTITLPHAAKLLAMAENEKLEDYIKRASRVKLIGAIIGVAILIIAGKPILGLFGESFKAGYHVLIILALGQLIIAAMGPLTQLLSISGHHNRSYYAFFSTLALMLILHDKLIAYFGILGASLTVIIAILVQSIWLYYLVVRHMGIHPAAIAFNSKSD
jgi:O-antigen/teichoic acid export membrane protein